MKLINEAALRKAIREELTDAVNKAKSLSEAGDIDLDLDVSELPGVPQNLKKLLDPDISPQKFDALDAELDVKGNETHQAFALLAFALTYSDRNVDTAIRLLMKAKTLAPKLKKMMEKSNQKPTGE